MLRSFCLNSALTIGLTVALFGQHQMGHAAPKAANPGPGPGAKNRRTIVDKWSRMSPEERQKALAGLPPERRKKVEEQLDGYKNLSPAEKRDLRSRYAWFDQLPPAKQNQVRRVYQGFNNLPQERRATVRSEFENLRSMPEAERNARLNSDEFRSKYNANEQNLLRNFSGLMNPSK